MLHPWTGRTGGAAMEAQADGRMVMVVLLAAAAGGCEAWARREPTTAAGLGRAAAAYRSRCSAILEEVIRGRDAVMGARPLPHSRRVGGEPRQA